MFTLFAGDRYYPYGGLNDIRGVFETLALAEEAFKVGDYDWVHISVGLQLVKTFYKHSD